MALVIALEAMGAHALQKFLAKPELARLFEPAVIQFKTACLGCICFAVVSHVFQCTVKIPLILAVLGMVLFSVNLWAIFFLKIQEVHVPWLGKLAPIGGFAYISSWVVFAFTLFKKSFSHEKP